ncbi:MAG: FkbM family methyltransferase [Thermoprotei archaeon]
MSMKSIFKDPCSALLSLYRYLFKVRGVRVKDHLRLLLTLLNYLVHLGTPGFMGYHIPGSKPVLIRTWDGYLFMIRPQTPDLEYATLIPEYYELTKWFLPNAKGVVIDIGANVGGYTVRACKQADKVIAIEPQRKVYKLLEFNVDINCRGGAEVVLINKAVADKQGIVYLEIPKDEKYEYAGGASIVRRYSSSHREPIEADTLDNIIDSILGLDEEITFVKIDIEGAEAIAFKGMMRTLSRTKYLMIEINEGNERLIKEFIKLGFNLLDRRRRNYFFIKSI